MMQGRLGTSGHLTLTPLNRQAAPAAPESNRSALKYWRVWVVLTEIHLCQGSSCQRANVLSKHVSGALSDAVWRKRGGGGGATIRGEARRGPGGPYSARAMSMVCVRGRSLRYNLQAENLAAHGLHPRWTHVPSPRHAYPDRNPESRLAEDPLRL
jgi:hypothetical protein